VLPKRYIILLLGAGASVVAAILVWLLIPEDDPERVSVGQAVQQFRTDTGTDGARGSIRGPRPEFGVYRYETDGEETLSASLLSGSHDYDGVSTVAIRAGDCGVVERWQVLAGRWREAEGCTTGSGEKASSLSEAHEFFGSLEKDVYRCSGPATSDPMNLEPGERLVTSCRSASGLVVTTMEVRGAELRRIDGRLLRPVLVEGRSLIRGDSFGSAEFIDWRRRSDGLLLGREVTSQVESDAYGGMSYGESYRLRLLSLSPER
jgi:hypothetical protein